jgi:hypothetical protein
VCARACKNRKKNKKKSQLCRELGWLALGKDGKLLTRISALPRACQAGSRQRKAKEGFAESRPGRLSAKIFLKKN